MLDENKNIDSLFADGLKGMSVAPDPELWHAIQNKMMVKKRKRMLVIYLSTGIAAALLAILVLSTRDLFDSGSNSVQYETIVKNSNYVPSNQQESIKSANQSESNHLSENTVDIADSGNVKPIHENGIVKARSSNGGRGKDSEMFKKDLLLAVTKPVYTAIYNSEKKLPLEFPYHSVDKDNRFIQLADAIKINNNLLLLEQQQIEKPKDRWSIIGQLSSAYSNEKSGESINSGIVSLGGGVKVNYILAKKLAFQTGVMYNKYGQEYGGSRGDMLFSDLNGVDGEYSPGMSSSQKFFPANTNAGIVKYKSMPQDALADNIITSAYRSSENLIQSFQTIEIPFLLRYDLSQKRLGFFVTGGFGANFLVGNGVYQQSGSKQKIGEIENLRTVNYNSHLGFGLEYQLNSKLQIGIEPGFKYYLNSINKSNQFDYKPYSIGVFTGIRYRF